MEEPRKSELLRLGREAAVHVVGAAAVEQVEVEAGADSANEPAYWFTFVIEEKAAIVRPRPGSCRSRFGSNSATCYLIEKTSTFLISRY